MNLTFKKKPLVWALPLGQDTLQISQISELGHYQMLQPPFLSMREKQNKGGKTAWQKEGNRYIITTFTQFLLWVRCYLRLCHLLFHRMRFFKNVFIFIYLSLAALGLHCCARAFSSCSELGLLLVVVCRLLTAVASLVAEHGL